MKKAFNFVYLWYLLRADATQFTESGVISSPGWPDYYEPSSFWSGSCKWEILATSTKVVKLNFMDVDIYFYGGSCSSFEYLTVKGNPFSIEIKDTSR